MTAVVVHVPSPDATNRERLSALADLAAAADPAFMHALDVAGLGQLEAREAMTRQLLDGSSDFYSMHVVERDRQLGGMLCAFPLNQLFSRRSVSLRHLLASAAQPRALRESLSRFAGGLPALDGDAYYLARIAVAPEWRSQGLGRHLMDCFENEAKRAGFDRTCLHVLTENKGAVNFYRALGYIPIGKGSSHTAMHRIGSPQT